jgi:hypothetical protein
MEPPAVNVIAAAAVLEANISVLTPATSIVFVAVMFAAYDVDDPLPTFKP